MPNTSAYEKAMNVLKSAMQELTPIDVVQDGMGLEDKVKESKAVQKERALLKGPGCGYGSDTEGTGVGNLLDLTAPERKRKPGLPYDD